MGEAHFSKHERSDQRLHIVFITATDLPEGGGGTSRLKALVGALSRHGHSVHILNEHALGISPQAAQIPTGTVLGARYEYVLGTVERRYGFAALAEKCKAVAVIHRRIKSLWKEGKVDILWFNQLSFYDTYPLTLLARRLEIPTVQSYEDERFELVSQNKLSLARRAFGLNSYLADRCCPAIADGIVVISRYLVEKYARLSRKPSKVHLIPTIIDCDAWKCAPEPAIDTPIILYTGCLGEQDEMENILIALAKLRDQGLRFKFVMLGGTAREDGCEREAQIGVQIRELKLTSMVERRGFVPLHQVRSELEKANILVNIRRDGVWSRSGLSTKLSEYLASGRLVVSSAVGDVGQYLKDDESALLVSPNCTPDEIAAAFGRALCSRELRARIGEGGRRVALTCFDVPVAQERLRSLFKGVFLPKRESGSSSSSRRGAETGLGDVAATSKESLQP
jgi:glycosyltransferase involved in cell wall biosynthesis